MPDTHTDTHTDIKRRLHASHLTVRALLALVAVVLLAMTTAPVAGAVSDEEELVRFGSSGSGAGQLSSVGDIAADPVTGHVYVTDGFDTRISEFTPWGNFVKAFGWDVAPGAVNEQQEIRVRAETGQFKLTFGASTTTDIAVGAPGSVSEGPGSVEAALNALPSIGGAGGEVSVEAVPGTSDGKTPFVYVVVFKGSLAGTNVDQLTIANGATSPGGGVPTTSLEVRTRADGTPGGTGLESCTAESGCKEAIKGSGAGQFDGASHLAVDATGNVFVREAGSNNNRVQKFDSAGQFLLMFGGEVNDTTKENICTKVQLAGGNVCAIGTAGTAPGQFSDGVSDGIALGTGGQLFVGDSERIQRFNLQGEFEASIPVPDKKVRTLAFDPVSGGLYAYFDGTNLVTKLDSTTGEEISETFVFNGGNKFATDSAGNLYAQGYVFQEPLYLAVVMQFDSQGKPLSPPSCCGLGVDFAYVGIGALGINNTGTLYVSHYFSSPSSSPPPMDFIRAFGPGPVSFEAAPKVPPTITGQFSTAVGRDEATVAAEINPHFWADTRYYIEYGTGKCSDGGCTESKPVPPGAILSSKTVDAALKSVGVTLDGLQAGTTYHYRFVAESSGGGPVYGIDPDGKGPEEATPEAGEEAEFTTFPAAASRRPCANDPFRVGPAARLPNCRAYEMVSPVDKNNGDIRTLLSITSYPTSLSQSATDGSRFTYSSHRGFADPKSAVYTNQYLAARKDGVGWSSEPLEPAQDSHFRPLNSFENHYKLFSADLCQGWLMVEAEPVLAPGVTAGREELYRRKGGGACGAVSYEALIQSDKATTPLLQGASADGSKAVFATHAKLTPDAASGFVQVYYTSNGQLRPLCVLPSGLPNASNCTAGTGSEAGSTLPVMERHSSLTNALSTDGSKAYWTDLPPAANSTGPGKIYLRLNPGAEQSASGCEEEKACTVAVSGTVSPQNARFLRASADGTKALFEFTAGGLAGNLYMFDAEAQSSILIAAKGLGVAGASDDLSRVYFVSENVLVGTSGATAGEPNLYLDEEGAKTFVATLAAGDVAGGSGVSSTNSAPLFHTARATPDGRVLAFTSSESLTGYDNTDQLSGKADSEVYLYEAGAAGPVCVSCNPSAARPTGRIVAPPHISTPLPTAAWLPLPENSLYTPRVLSNDGSRLIFNSFDALLLRDTNGKADVYEWEAASGQKACDEKGAELYVPGSGGCLSLISTGQSPQDSELLDISASGNDVFFTTNASLLPQDPGLVDVYDARVGGGLPAPPEPPGPCQGEACQFAPPPPNDPTPASASFKGAGDPRATKPRPRCAKGKARRKGRCVAKRKASRKAANRKRAKTNRRASR